MPTPAALQEGQRDPFAISQQEQPDNRVSVVYATNRLPTGLPSNRSYLTLFDQDIRLGTARVRIGGETLSWQELHAASLSGVREGPIPMTLEQATEYTSIAPGDQALAPGAERFFTDINQRLAALPNKDIIVYVHGANNNFYRASAQAAQFHHFTGRNAVVLVFAWPSAESLLRYAVDVNNAQRSEAVFARLIELLARHTTAERIDVLAYSAGAQVLGPALALLKRGSPATDVEQLHERLRLGEVYFAAPDIDFRPFIADLSSYVGIADHITVAVNPDDTVLALAARHHRQSRAGKPDPDELTAEETQWLIEASRTLPIDLLWITSQQLPGMGRGAHDFWYNHPWASTDVLIQLLFSARPAERGLESYEEAGQARVWYFPDDYPQRANASIERLRAQHGVPEALP
jgi:esterase/lipase superfamily enzyme